MTTGIYALYWEEIGAVYIGQSIVIEQRLWAHKNALIRNNHANSNVSRLYTKFGLPSFITIEECDERDLDTLEILWVNEFDSPLNIQEPGVRVGSGLRNPNSRYSKRRILRAFVYLYKYGYSQHKVSSLTNIPRGTLSHIVCGKAHFWLSKEYPEQFDVLKSKAAANLLLKHRKK